MNATSSEVVPYAQLCSISLEQCNDIWEMIERIRDCVRCEQFESTGK